MNYVPIRLKTLRPTSRIIFDVYIKIGERYVHYIKKDDTFEDERMNNLISKGVKKLFINEESEQYYLDYLDQGLDQLENSDFSAEERGSIANDSLVTAAENSERIIESEIHFKKTTQQVDKIVKFLTSESSALKSIIASTGLSKDEYQHNANLASLAVSFASEAKINKPQELLDLGLAALIHTLGLKKLGISIDDKPEEMDETTRKKYQTHPTVAVEGMNQKTFISAGLLTIIANQEEVGKGEGFPEKKVLKQLPPVCQAFNICNNYDLFCRRNKIEPLDAIGEFFTERLGLFELDHLNILKKVIIRA